MIIELDGLHMLVCLASVLCMACMVRIGSGPDKDWSKQRAAMLDQLRTYRIRDRRILDVMAKVRRHVFIPETHRTADAYGNHPCPIGYGQTISQPYIAAYMTEHLELKAGGKVLEIGTGSGYQAAILAELGHKVHSIEIIPELVEHARTVLKAEGCIGVELLTGDGYRGWPEHSPFDAIIVTCAPDKVPRELTEQLSEGGRMIIPVGTASQHLVILRKKHGKIEKANDLAVKFVPMVHHKR